MNWHRLADLTTQYWEFLCGRHWANWELVTAACVATLTLILIIVKRSRKEAGVIPEFELMAAGGAPIADNQRISLLQQEIVKRDHSEARLERDISELTSANKRLQARIGELTSANEQLKDERKRAREASEKEIADLTAFNKQLQRDVAASKNSGKHAVHEIANLAAAYKRLQGKIAELTAVNEQLRQAKEVSEHKAVELVIANEQLRREVTESEKGEDCSKQEIAELSAANEQLRQKVEVDKKACERSKREIADLTAANEQLRQAKESSDRKAVELVGVNEKLQREVAANRKVEDRCKQEIAELTAANEQLRQEIEVDKKAWERSKREIADLTTANEQLRQQAVEGGTAAASRAHNRHKAEAPWVRKVVPATEISLRAKSAAQQLEELAEEVGDLNLQEGLSNSADARRKAILEARDYLDADNASMAAEALKRFIDSVEAQHAENDETLQKEDAEDVIAAARGIIDLLAVQSAAVDAD